MSQREPHRDDDFDGWPSAAWSGDPDDPPARGDHRAHARGEDGPDAASEPAARTAEPELEAEPEAEPAAEPGVEHDAQQDVEHEVEAGDEALDISAEHHAEEQWSDEDAVPDDEALPEPEPEPEEVEAEPEVEGEEAAHAVLEHAGGELEVPPGYTVLEGEPRGDRRAVGIVISRFNGAITNRMLETALAALAEAGVPQDAITVMPVPGAFELPLAAMALAKTRRYACIVALGAVIRGGTPHFEFVATEAASGLQLAQIETGVPVAFGVLTCDDVAQAEARIYKSREAVESALEMADVFAKLRATAKTA
jgi:6,7-dimethyl-8-ribityllumazine synthase